MEAVELREVLGVETLRGRDTETPVPLSNVVRVFISSAVSDFNTERNAFWEKVYPDLQSSCQSLGLVFEAVDLRWGLWNSITVDHQTTELCLQEIQSCQKVSPGLSFIALIGSQYGPRPLPRLIPETEFQLLLSKLSQDQEGLNVLKKWFFKDDNVVPPQYVLQPITTYFPYYNNTAPEAGAQHDADVLSWNLTEARLLQLLCNAALRAQKDGDFSAEQKHKYFKSMTEWEMEQSFLSTPEQSKTSPIIFIRELPHLKKGESHKHAKFLDVTADGLLDTEAQELLSNLKQRISSVISDLLTFELSKNALDVNRKEHKEYLEKFCEQIVCRIKDRITKQSSPPTSPEWLWIQQELFHHAKLSKEKYGTFNGRDGLLAKISISMWESTNIQHAPLVVYGPPEVGKTSLLCKLAQEMQTVLDPQAVVVLRMLGTSPNSSDVDSVLKGICLQVCGAMGLANPSPQTANTHEKLVRFFHSLLQKVSENGESLVLILDSLDDLSRANNAHKLLWIPKELPPNVHLVVSALHGGTPFKRLKALISDDQSFYRVEPLDCDQEQDIINAYLNAAGRRLTYEQRDVITGSFLKSGSLLHLKLMVDMAKQWSSYTSVSELHLGSSVQETISLFLQTLEKKHGEKLVCHTLGYITLSRRGLSEAEVRDILSVDNDVLAEVYQSRLPPSPTLIRFPPLLWSRLRHDLKDHLLERQENGIIVLTFSQRQFTDVVKAKYLSVERRVQMHSVLSEYFSGQWSQGQLKPILLSSLNTQLNADRKVPHQPLWLTEGVANLRKLQELPYHLLHSGKWEELRHSLLGNLDWLYCKTLSCGVTSVIQDLSLCADITDCPEVQLIRDCFLLLKPTLDFIDGHTDSPLLVTEITARLQALAPVYPSLIGPLCSQCDGWFASCADPVLVPRSNFLPSPGGPLINTISASAKGITAVDLFMEKGLLLAGSVDGELIAWDLKCLELLHIFEGHTGAVQTVKFINKGDHCLSTGLDGSIRKWNLLTGKQLHCIPAVVSLQPWPTEQILVLEPKAMVLSITGGQVKSWSLDTGELLYEVDVKGECSLLSALGEEVAVMSSEGQIWIFDSDTGLETSSYKLSGSQGFTVCSVLSLHRHGKLLITSQEGSLNMVSASGSLSEVDLPAPASFMCTSEDENVLFAGCERTLAVLHLNPDSVHKSQELQHEATVLSAVSYSQGSKVLTGSQDQIIRVWGLVTGHLLDSFSGMGSPVTSVTMYNTTIISASTRSGHLKLWQLDYNPKHKNQACVPANCPRVVISRDGNTVHFIREEDRAKVFSWNCSEGMSSDTMDVCSEVCCMELAQQKQLLFCGLCTGTVLIYPLAFPQETLCLPPPESLPTVRSMAISPREDKIAVAYEETVSLFEITARDSFPCVEGPIHNYSLSLLHSSVSAMALLPDCRLLYGTFGGEVAIYDFKSATAMEVDHHGAAITCIALSNWDKHALVGSEDCVQKLWSLSPVLLDHTMEYKGFYFEGILCAAFSVNDKYVFTGSRDKTVKVWDVATGSLLYIQYVYAAVIKITPYKDGFVAISQHGAYIKEGFHCPNAPSPDYNPLRNFRAHYRVTSREKSLDAPHSVITGLHSYNPAQFNFMGVLKTKQSSTCVLL
ncbi:NACHT domain- and WD repeat-containing protein 1 isoform X2 [Silurus asotus]|uniref:NACHT domain- and WD repeat-containing protein 1 isoform X2 n=1 Tax=Silurus asotus TaxID=30991 RepID=A0AAD5B0W5_SILAS|nr:NACHT domain- and WD repeat-containing protein 1 isoform X2 [Silurus asotus]